MYIHMEKYSVLNDGKIFDEDLETWIVLIQVCFNTEGHGSVQRVNEMFSLQMKVYIYFVFALPTVRYCKDTLWDWNS